MTPAWIRPIEAALAEAGWHGDVSVDAGSSPDGDTRVHVRWNGRHVEAVSVEAAAEFIRRDAAAKEAEADMAAREDGEWAEMLAEENDDD